MTCLLQYKELKHSKVRNEHGSWQPQVETVYKHISDTLWSLKDDSSLILPVIEAQNADELHLLTAGKYVYLFCKCNISAREPTAVCLVVQSLLHVSSISVSYLISAFQ